MIAVFFETSLTAEQISDTFAVIRRFEATRVGGAIFIMLVLAAILPLLGQPQLDLIPAAGIVFFLVLGWWWLNVVRRAESSAGRYAGPVGVTLTDHAIGTVAATGTVEARWDEIAHCSYTPHVWVFTAKKTHTAFIVPRGALNSGEAAQLATMLSKWSKRRHRNVAIGSRRA